MFTTAEPYDGPTALIHHTAPHQRVRICPHYLSPVPLATNETRPHRIASLTYGRKYQHFSPSPRTTHLLHEAEEPDRRFWRACGKRRDMCPIRTRLPVPGDTTRVEYHV
jgi:hypothetical protein